MNFNSLLPFTSAAVGGAVALAALVRPNRTISRWAFAAGLLVLAAESLLIGLDAGGTITPDSMLKWQQWRLITLALLPGGWILFSLSYARGDALKMLTRWQFPLAAATVLPVGFVLLFRQDLLHQVTVDGKWFLRMGWPGIALHSFMLVSAVFVLMNLERTYRDSVGTMRWRIKFMVLGAGILFVVRIYSSSQILLFREVDPLVESVNSGALLLAAVLFVRGFSRDGDFNLDVYPSHSVLQNSLTALLAGIYLLLVGVFAKVAMHLGGDTTFAVKAFLALVSLVLLTLLLQSDHVRLHLRRFISRHFQRPLYDYRLVWKTFTEGTASCVDQTDLCRALVRLIADMFQSLSVTILLVDDQQKTLLAAASTSLTSLRDSNSQVQKTDATVLLEHFRAHPEPVDFETSPLPWAVTLRSLHPAVFAHGGHRVCIPIMGRGEMLGLITLGDRVAGVAFTVQDLEMLKCACDHAAACLLNVQLSRKLLQAKELEAFQTMAAFFVHDLKNAASTLNLMLQNLPEHFDDPAFREDALRGTSKTVAHINHLIGRLSLLRHELKIQPSQEDLNAVVNKAVAGLEAGEGFTLTKDFAALPEFSFDQVQITKVVTNLVLNARESMPGPGQVHLTTSRTDGWAILSVRDRGCGMTADFINRSLFRPFQTTKKSGLGIGMFQSKMIVEAHGGRIAVTSEPGQGTTFQVFLPIPA